MFQHLPVEIGYHIIEIAAEEWVASDDVPAALQLALLSRSIRAVVTPIAYHTLFITETNCDRLVALANRSAQPLAAVRHVFVDKQVEDKRAALILVACSNVQGIDATVSLFSFFKDVPAFRPQRVALRFESLADARRLPAAIAQHITHVEGYYIPSQPSPPVYVWVPALLTALPAMTHVALDIADLFGDPNGDVPQCINNLVAAVSAFLESTQLQQIVLHASDAWAHAWDAADGARRVAGLRDARVFAWVDRRSYTSWHEEEQLRADDLRSGRSVWNSGEQLYRT